MKNNNNVFNNYQNQLDQETFYKNSGININISDTQQLKNSLNRVKSLCNILKEKNNIIDGMLLSTKRKKNILIQETEEKENEIIQLENEINIYYDKLFSEYFQGDNRKSRILSKIKFLRKELTHSKYIDYLNKKIMVEQKEENMQKKLSLLTTEQLEQFNKEIYNNQIFNDKEKQNIELMKKQYEDIKKTEIFKRIFSEIKKSLSNKDSMNSSMTKSKKKFNSKMLNVSQSNHGSQASLNTNSQKNYEMRSGLFSNKERKKKGNNSVEVRNLVSSDNPMYDAYEQISATYKYLLTNKNYCPNGFMNKKNSKFNSKFFTSNQN